MLTKYPTASLRELLWLSFPLILSLFSSSLMGFCDRLFLAHYSLEALEGSVSASYLCQLFQYPIIRIVAMTQVFVALYKGSNRFNQIGESVWQMIWLSLFSMLITYPASVFVGPFYFSNTSIEGPASIYFNTLMVVNFLFPVGIALSSYFIGQGRTRIVFLVTLLSHSLNIGLDALFIFGIDGYLPAMGIFGAALATGISQALFCAVLFFFFLRKKERTLFQTDQFQIKWDKFWGQLRIGLPKAVARISILTAWVCIARIMTLKGGEHLMVLSIGGTLILLFTFINDGMSQGMITVSSYLLGAKQYSDVWKVFRSGLIFLGVTSVFLTLPYLIFPQWTLSFFFIDTPAPETLQMLKHSCIWLWIFFFCYGFNSLGLSLVTASRDVNFYMVAIMFTWFTSFIPTYLAMNLWNWSPDKLWLIMAFDSLIFGGVFLMRSSKEKWKKTEFNENFETILSR